ncbi:hypothetical protein F4804DRAFT_317171 [Jackrogersella minutella]|nr:hypothetical protein F4804DRAFT_317171 [Jackrogersella minutella]
MSQEKKRTKSYADLPAWYHRIMRNTAYVCGEADLNPWDFDEDISEISETEEKPFVCRCEAMEDSELECECESDYESDKSDQSYNEDDADLYYELKQERDERKQDLKEIREASERAKKKALQLHQNKVEEVRAAYEALKKEKDGRGAPITFLEEPTWITDRKKSGRPAPSGNFHCRSFDLFSVDYTKYFYGEGDYNQWRYLEFHGSDEDFDTGKHWRTKGVEMKKDEAVEGDLYVNSSHSFAFAPFPVPKHASTKIYWSEPGKNEVKVGVQFVGQDYARMMISREFIEATQPGPLPASFPEVFEVVGVTRDYAKRKAEFEELNGKKRVRRSSSLSGDMRFVWSR